MLATRKARPSRDRQTELLSRASKGYPPCSAPAGGSLSGLYPQAAPQRSAVTPRDQLSEFCPDASQGCIARQTATAEWRNTPPSGTEKSIGIWNRGQGWQRGRILIFAEPGRRRLPGLFALKALRDRLRFHVKSITDRRLLSCPTRPIAVQDRA